MTTALAMTSRSNGSGLEAIMDEGSKHANEMAIDPREYIKALVLIAVILGLVLLLVWIGIGGSCGCTTPPAG